MLYNPEWGKPIKAESSLADFIAWLETHPADKQYDFGDCRGANDQRAPFQSSIFAHILLSSTF